MIWVVTGVILLLFVGNRYLSYRRNSRRLDSLAKDFGLVRIPGENNKELLTRMKLVLNALWVERS